jgi:hypothetical protein
MTDEAMSPSRRRMIEDMTIRKFAPKTQHDYAQGSRNSRPSLVDRLTLQASKMFAATSSISPRAASACRPSTRASRHCGFSSRSRSGEAIS